MADPATLAIITTAAQAATAGAAVISGVSALRGGPKAPPPIKTPTTTDAERDIARRKGEDVQRRAAAGRVGRRETILTTPLGATGEVRTAGRTVLGK